jgi:hypothetical protein
MGKQIRILALINVLLTMAILSPAVYAGIVGFSCDAGQWNYDSAADELNLNIGITSYNKIDMSGTSDNDPTFRVDEFVENASGLTWTGFELDLAPAGNAQFDYTKYPSWTWSDHFSNYVGLPLTLTFNSGSVANTDTVEMRFCISVPSSGLFSFTLTQTPIPEPATVALLGLGGLLMRRHKR